MDVEPTRLLIFSVKQIIERARIALGPRQRRHAKRGERVARNNPGRDRRSETFAQEGPQRKHLPALPIARRPVVEEREADDLVESVGYWNRITQAVAAHEVKAYFELEIEPLAGSEARPFAGRIRRPLTEWPAHIPLPDLNGGSSAVIGRHPFVVRRQRIFRGEQRSRRARVIDAGVEIRVVRNLRRKMHCGVSGQYQQLRRMTAYLVAGGAFVEQVSHGPAQIAKRPVAQRKQRIERGLLQSSMNRQEKALCRIPPNPWSNPRFAR